jgi:4-hydroxymandelate synthase
MNVTTIDHLELYVGDLARVAAHFRDGFGFRSLGHNGPAADAAGARSMLLGAGGIRLLLTQGHAPDHPASRYVERHGDGVACLAMRTDDAGAGATLAGPGSLTHRLVGAGHRLERAGEVGGGIAPVPAGPDNRFLETIDHLALCVPAGQLDPTVRHYQDAFGFGQIFEERVELGGQAMDSKVVQSPSREVTLTIVSPDPTGEAGQLDDFLRSHAGAGVQHVAFGTRDIATAVDTLRGRGVRFLTTPDGYYDGIERRLGAVSRPVAALRAGNILVDRDHWGEMFQIFTESPFPRRTCFFELIERRGALTFGSNNIKALYEANERARAATVAQA